MNTAFVTTIGFLQRRCLLRFWREFQSGRTNRSFHPRLCNFRYGEDGTTEVASEVFIAAKGAVAHLHFDWDHRHVVLYQVFGRKRVVVIPPQATSFLRPILNMSRLALQHLVEPLRKSLIRALGGLDVELRAGDAILIPALAWHYVEYHDLAMSVSFRFGRNAYGRIYAERFHANHVLQSFAWKTMNERPLSADHRKTVHNLVDAYLSSALANEALFDELSLKFLRLEAEDRDAPWIDATYQIERESAVTSGLYRAGCNATNVDYLRDILYRR